MDCIPLKLGQELERELSASLENQVKAQTEIKEIRNALGDDGRRTHKEVLEMAFKASGWREWKQKFIDLRNAHIAEGQDPAGTIWEHADRLQKELKEAKAEVERLKEAMISCLHITNCYDGNYARACDNVELIIRNALISLTHEKTTNQK
jgi:hypothetical protein